MTKYGAAVPSVVPASSTLAMFGWSIRASACRSASNRATTCARVHARLDDLQGDPPADRVGLLGHVDDAHARPRRSARAACTGRSSCPGASGPAPRRRSARAGARPARSRKLPARKWARDQRLDPPAEGGVAAAGAGQVGGPGGRRRRNSMASQKMVSRLGSAFGHGRTLRAETRVPVFGTVRFAGDAPNALTEFCRRRFETPYGSPRMRRAVQPGPGDRPVPLGRRGGDAQAGGRLLRASARRSTGA